MQMAYEVQNGRMRMRQLEDYSWEPQRLVTTDLKMVVGVGWFTWQELKELTIAPGIDRNQFILDAIEALDHAI